MAIVRHIRQGPPTLPEAKDPADVKDVHFLWGDVLDGAAPDSLVASASGVDVDSDSFGAATIGGVEYAGVHTVRISGGTARRYATVTSRCAYGSGLVEEVSVRIKIDDQ